MSELFSGNPTEEQQKPKETTQEATTAPETSTQEEVKQPETTPMSGLFVDQLSSIKTEDGRQKYADVPTALASIPHAQAKISELSSKVEQLEAELAKKKGVEEMLERIETSKTAEGTPSNAALDEAKVMELLQRQFSQVETEKLKEANRKTVVGSLEAQFGDKAQDVFNSKAEELGVNPMFLSDLAMQHPKMVLSYFSQPTTNKANPTVGSVNTTSMSQTHPVERKAVTRGASSKDVLEQFRAHATN